MCIDLRDAVGVVRFQGRRLILKLAGSAAKHLRRRGLVEAAIYWRRTDEVEDPERHKGVDGCNFEWLVPAQLGGRYCSEVIDFRWAEIGDQPLQRPRLVQRHFMPNNVVRSGRG